MSITDTLIKPSRAMILRRLPDGYWFSLSIYNPALSSFCTVVLAVGVSVFRCCKCGSGGSVISLVILEHSFLVLGCTALLLLCHQREALLA